MTDKNDLKPGDFAQHPKKGNGIVSRGLLTNEVGVMYADLDRDGIYTFTIDLTGWERAEIVKPGHVQVRVDDLADDLESEWGAEDEVDYSDLRYRVAIRVAKAQAAQRTESAPTADGQDANVEAFPHTVMVELRCPHGCGAPVRAKLSTDGYSFPEGGAWPRLVAVPQHTCQLAQPDEPTGLGAVVEVGGKRFVRTDEDGHPWIDNVAYWHTWDEITDRGPVTVLSEGVQS